MKGKKKAAKSKDSSIEPKDRCIWSETNETALITHISTHRAKAGDRMNFDRTFWVSAAEAVASVRTEGSHGAAKSSEACSTKWSRLRKLYQVVNKIAHSSSIAYSLTNGANISDESEMIWADIIKNNPQAKAFRLKGWPHYDTMHDILKSQAQSTWTGFHPSINTNSNTLTPSATPSASDVIMATLESALDKVEFGDHSDYEMNDAQGSMLPKPPAIAQGSTSTLPKPPVIAPVPAQRPFLIPHAPPSLSTPASSTAVKRKAEDDDSSRYNARPPHSSKSKKSAASSKSQRLTMPLALEDLGGKVADSIAQATSTIQGHMAEPVPTRKQRAVLQVQDEDLSDGEVLTMIKIFQSDVTVADSYLAIRRDGVRRLFLIDYLQDYEKGKGRE